jgi:phosphonate metabolism protein (transferase hexapeptide repeat family)
MEIRLGLDPHFHPGVTSVDSVFGRYTEIGENCWFEHTVFGDYSYCGGFCIVQNAEIGKFGNIAAAVQIGPTNHPIDRPTRHHFTYRRRMYGFADADDTEFFAARARQIARIGHDTWIGHGAIIMPGVTVGNGAVIGAGAVVTRDVAPYTVCAGVPARSIRDRCAPVIAQRLERIAWWDWSHEVIRQRLDDFTGSIEAFVERYGDSGERT